MKTKIFSALSITLTASCLVALVQTKLAPVRYDHRKLVLVKCRLPDKYTWNGITRSGIEHFEKYFAHTYICPAGVATIGYGFTDKKLVDKDFVSRENARKILNEKLNQHCALVKKHVKVKLTASQVYALASFTYNCGEGNLLQLINGKGRLNSGNYKSVARLMPKYSTVKGKTLRGLVLRREWEVKLWNGKV